MVVGVHVGRRVSAPRGPLLPLALGQRRQRRALKCGRVVESVGPHTWEVMWDDGTSSTEKSTRLRALPDEQDIIRQQYTIDLDGGRPPSHALIELDAPSNNVEEVPQGSAPDLAGDGHGQITAAPEAVTGAASTSAGAESPPAPGRLSPTPSPPDCDDDPNGEFEEDIPREDQEDREVESDPPDVHAQRRQEAEALLAAQVGKAAVVEAKTGSIRRVEWTVVAGSEASTEQERQSRIPKAGLKNGLPVTDGLVDLLHFFCYCTLVAWRLTSPRSMRH